MVRSNGIVSDAGKVVECDPPRRLAYTFINLSDTYKGELSSPRSPPSCSNPMASS